MRTDRHDEVNEQSLATHVDKNCELPYDSRQLWPKHVGAIITIHFSNKLVTNIGRVYINIYVIWRHGQCKGKGKVHPRTGHEGPEGEQRCSSTLSLTSALDGGRDTRWRSWLRHCATSRKVESSIPDGVTGFFH